MGGVCDEWVYPMKRDAIKLEEMESQGEGQANQAKALGEAAEDHRQQAEQLQGLQEQLERIELVSSDLEEAQAELGRYREHIASEQEQLDQKRRALIQENLELMERCEKALEKSLASMGGSRLLQSIGRGLAVEALKISAGIITGIASGNPHRAEKAIDTRINAATEATTRHVKRLEKTKEQLLETRKLLDKESRG